MSHTPFLSDICRVDHRTGWNMFSIPTILYPSTALQHFHSLNVGFGIDLKVLFKELR